MAVAQYNGSVDESGERLQQQRRHQKSDHGREREVAPEECESTSSQHDTSRSPKLPFFVTTVADGRGERDRHNNGSKGRVERAATADDGGSSDRGQW